MAPLRAGTTGEPSLSLARPIVKFIGRGDIEAEMFSQLVMQLSVRPLEWLKHTPLAVLQSTRRFRETGGR